MFVLLAVATVMSGARVPAQSVPRTRYPISEPVVAAALRSSGLDIKPSQVHLPMVLSSASASPELEIISTERLPGNRIRLRLRCQNAGDCVPFDATLDVPTESAIAAISSASRIPDGSAPQPGAPHPSAAMQRDNLAEPASQQIAPSAAVHVGDHVVLSMADGRMRIHLPVIAIDTGVPGSEIRVCTEDRKKTFRATVLDQSTVEGVLR